MGNGEPTQIHVETKETVVKMGVEVIGYGVGCSRPTNFLWCQLLL